MQLIDNYQPLCQLFLNSYKLKYMSTYRCNTKPKAGKLPALGNKKERVTT
jgi:hypothetical protein